MADDIPFDKRFDLAPGQVEEVMPGVRRLLANNPGPFTFTGTVSYIIGAGVVAAGTGAEPHSHPNEQWIYVLQGTLRGSIGDQKLEAKAGSVIYIPADATHAMKATPEADVVFFTCKDSSYGLQGIKAK